MNMNGLINMVLRRLFRQVMNRGIAGGIDMAAGKGKPKAEMTHEERQQAAGAKQTAKRARQAARLSRRMMR
jgi:hypothetical protein